jgi:hypothetical protein
MDAFLKFLQDTPQMLATFVQIVVAFREKQAEAVVLPPASGAGPDVFTPGQPHPLTTVDLSPEQLQAIYGGYAEAIVKEKAIEFIKGFVSGLVMASGGAA